MISPSNGLATTNKPFKDRIKMYEMWQEDKLREQKRALKVLQEQKRRLQRSKHAEK